MSSIQLFNLFEMLTNMYTLDFFICFCFVGLGSYFVVVVVGFNLFCFETESHSVVLAT